MNILISINEIGRGGAERVVSYLLRYLPKLDTKNKYYLHLLEQQKKVYPLPENIKIFGGRKEIFSIIMKFFRIPFQSFQLKKIVRENKITTVLSVLNRANYVNILSHISGGKYKCIISERNTPSLVYSSSNIADRINRFLIQKLYPYSDKIIAISGGVKNDLVENFNIPEQNVVVIYNPIDINTINNKSEEKIEHKWLNDHTIKTIISVGRLEKQKNHVLLIKAFQNITTRFSESRLLIIGEGSQRKTIGQLISRLGLDMKVELAGLQNNPFAFLSRADIFVLSSDFEGFGNVITEAMLCGCPVISTDCKSGPNEIITNNHNGILVPVGNVEAMSDAMISLLEDQSLRDTLAANAQTRVLDFNLDNIIQQYYQTLV